MIRARRRRRQRSIFWGSVKLGLAALCLLFWWGVYEGGVLAYHLLQHQAPALPASPVSSV